MQKIRKGGILHNTEKAYLCKLAHTDVTIMQLWYIQQALMIF
jgi:hypothetical protein